MELAFLGPDPDAAAHRGALAHGCRITGCPARHEALGLCVVHYQVHRRAVRNEAHLLNRAAAA